VLDKETFCFDPMFTLKFWLPYLNLFEMDFVKLGKDENKEILV
jgi:hypothetical protein